MGSCPFNKYRHCRTDCELYREEVRQPDQGNSVVIKGCSLRLNLDHSMNINQRLAMIQKEEGEIKNMAVFQSMAMLTDDPVAKNELQKIIMRNMTKGKALE